MFYDLLEISANRSPGKLAIVDRGLVYSYEALLSLVSDRERLLRHEGVGHLDTVAIQLPNSAEWIATFLAADRIGATVLPLDPSLKAQEVESYCIRAGVEALVRQSSPTPGTDEARPPMISSVPQFDIVRLAANPGRRPHDGEHGQLACQEPRLLFLSSGSTGLPKIVPRAVAQADAHRRLSQAGLPRIPTDVVLAVLPFCHTLGLLRVVVVTLAEGATLVVEQYSPRISAATIARSRVSVFMATPLMLRLLVETEFHPVPDFSSLRVVGSGGAALSAAAARAFEGKFGAPVESFYGSAETGPIAHARATERTEEAGWVGRPYDAVRVEIWDSSGSPQEAGVPGQIAVRSPAAATSYLDEPDATERTFRRGYVLPGDRGCLKRDGHLFVLARERPMINVAGKKVSPAEVEACLLSHPGVAEAFVVAERAESGVDRVKALVVPTKPVTVSELREFCRQRLADFKVPRQILLVKDVRRGPLGKPRLGES